RRAPVALLARHRSRAAARGRRRGGAPSGSGPGRRSGRRRTGAVLMPSVDPATLIVLAAELRDVRSGLDGLAECAGDWIGGLSGEARLRALTDAQAFDFLGQRLAALAEVLQGLGEGRPAAELTAAVPLADLAARLSGSETEASADSGDLALFE